MHASPLVRVESKGLIDAATACWRLRGNIRATVVVKAEFSFANGTLTQVQAQPVQPATELAFVLTQAEILFAGLRRASSSESARITLWRGNQELIGIDVDDASVPSPGGRISPFAPERAAHLSGMSPAALLEPFVELPDAFDSAFFQSAPPAQRIANLAGGDTVVLDNLFPGHRRLTLQIPVVEVAGSGRMGEREAPIRFGLDTLYIDAQNHRCSMLWRGRIAASTVEALKLARAVVHHKVTDAGRVQGDMPPPWPRIVAIPAAAMKPVSLGASPFEGTVDLGADALRVAAAAAPTPFAQGATTRSGPVQPAADIPGAPWASSDAAAVVPASAGILETCGVGTRSDYGTSPPPGRPAPPDVVRPPEMVAVAEPGAAPDSAHLETPAPVPDTKTPAPVANTKELEEAQAKAEAERQRTLEEAEEKRLEEERLAQEQAEAERRRREETERFEAEQRALEKAAAEREAREAAALKQSRQKIKTGMYGSWKFKNKK